MKKISKEDRINQLMNNNDIKYLLVYDSNLKPLTDKELNEIFVSRKLPEGNIFHFSQELHYTVLRSLMKFHKIDSSKVWFYNYDINEFYSECNENYFFYKVPHVDLFDDCMDMILWGFKGE